MLWRTCILILQVKRMAWFFKQFSIGELKVIGDCFGFPLVQSFIGVKKKKLVPSYWSIIHYTKQKLFETWLPAFSHVIDGLSIFTLSTHFLMSVVIAMYFGLKFFESQLKLLHGLRKEPSKTIPIFSWIIKVWIANAWHYLREVSYQCLIFLAQLIRLNKIVLKWRLRQRRATRNTLKQRWRNYRIPSEKQRGNMKRWKNLSG